MAWRCTGSTNTELIENMWRHRLISDAKVKDAFLKVRPHSPYRRSNEVLTADSQVDRAHYSPSAPYVDSPQYIGYGATISAPHMHATALEHIIPYLLPSDVSPAPRAIDIGSGSGYLTHVMAELVGDRGLVVGIEHIHALRELGEKNMKRSNDGSQFIESGKVKFVVGDGRKGYKEPARQGEEQLGTQWDVIHVGASAAKVHAELLDQLKAPGWYVFAAQQDK